MYVQHQKQWISSASALFIMGITSLAVGLWLLRLLPPQWHSPGVSWLLKAVCVDHCGYRGWAIATAAVTWVPGSVYYALLAAWVGLEGSAALRAIMNLVMPILHANSANAVLLLPIFVRASTTRGRTQFNRLLHQALILLAVGSVCYWVFLLYFYGELLHWLYGGRYTEETNALLLAGRQPLPAGVTAVFGSALRALERPDQMFWSRTVGAVVTMTFGLWFLLTYGVSGAVMAGLASSVTAAVAAMLVFRRLMAKHQGVNPSVTSDA